MTHNQQVFLVASLYLGLCFFVSAMTARHGLRHLDKYPISTVRGQVMRAGIAFCLLAAAYVVAVFVKLMHDGVNYPH